MKISLLTLFVCFVTLSLSKNQSPSSLTDRLKQIESQALAPSLEYRVAYADFLNSANLNLAHKLHSLWF